MPNVYFIPSGPKNLAALFPAVDWSTITEYYIEVTDGSTVLATSPTYQVEKYCEDTVRIHFQNHSGGIDSLPLTLIDVQHESKSDSFQAPTKFPLIKTDHGINRFNIKANTTYTGVTILAEEQLKWVKELQDSPAAWLEWIGTQNQADDYLPIVILDQKIPEFEEANQYENQVTVSFMLSHEVIIIQS